MVQGWLMARIQYGTSSYERARGDLPPLPVRNMFAEEAPTEETQLCLQSRPALHDRAANMGAGEIKALFRRNGVVTGALFGVAGGNLYQETVSKGAIPGSGPVSIAGNDIGIMVAAGSTLSYYNGAALASVVFPDTANVIKVFAGASRFWCIRAGTGRIYWTPPLAATVAALAYATAESMADELLDGLWIDDTAVLFGKESVEFWPNTGDANLPIQPLEGRVFELGIRATGCATVIGATFAWVTNDNTVCLNGQEPQPISNAGLNAKIAASVECRLFTCLIDGRELLALRLDSECHIYGLQSGRWSQFVTYGGNWAALCHADGVFGAAAGKTLAWFDDHLELGGTLERLFTAGFAINSGGVPISNLSIRTNPGNTPYLVSDYADPRVEMRISRNGGKTWGDWKQRSLGTQGSYRDMVQWRGLGMVSQPGFLCQFRVSDPVPFRVSDVRINEKYGGR